jgi:hypothetical protein
MSSVANVFFKCAEGRLNQYLTNFLVACVQGGKDKMFRVVYMVRTWVTELA